MLEESKELWTQRSGSMLANLEHHKAWKTAGYFLALRSQLSLLPHTFCKIFGQGEHPHVAALRYLADLFSSKLGDIYNQVLPLYHHVIPPCNTMWPINHTTIHQPWLVQAMPSIPWSSKAFHRRFPAQSSRWRLGFARTAARSTAHPQSPYEKKLGAGEWMHHRRHSTQKWTSNTPNVSFDIKCIKYIKDTRFLNPQ